MYTYVCLAVCDQTDFIPNLIQRIAFCVCLEFVGRILIYIKSSDSLGVGVNSNRFQMQIPYLKSAVDIHLYMWKASSQLPTVFGLLKRGHFKNAAILTLFSVNNFCLPDLNAK